MLTYLKFYENVVTDTEFDKSSYLEIMSKSSTFLLASCDLNKIQIFETMQAK